MWHLSYLQGFHSLLQSHLNLKNLPGRKTRQKRNCNYILQSKFLIINFAVWSTLKEKFLLLFHWFSHIYHTQSKKEKKKHIYKWKNSIIHNNLYVSFMLNEVYIDFITTKTAILHIKNFCLNCIQNEINILLQIVDSNMTHSFKINVSHFLQICKFMHKIWVKQNQCTERNFF